MSLIRHQLKRIRHLLPKPRGKAAIGHFRFVHGLIFMARNGCKWRALPERFGPWHTIYMRLYRWAHNGQLSGLLSHLQQAKLSLWCAKALSLDSTIVKVHPDGCGARKKTARKPLARAVGVGPASCTWFQQVPATQRSGV